MKKTNLLFITGLVGLTVGLASCNKGPATVAVESVTISGPNEVVIGNQVTLTAAVNPENATDKTITWSSEQTNFATVDQNGVVSAIAVGTATIKATASNGVFGSYQVTVKPIDVASVVISGASTVEKGENITLTATVTPDNATVKDVTWSSEQPTIASVNGGVVTGLAKGTATIKATANNNVFGSFDVVVTEHFNISYPTVSGMTFEGPAKAQEGEFVSFSITTNTALASVKANGNECGKNADGYFFFMPGRAVEITVEEASVPPSVTKYAINNKSRVVSLIGDAEAEAGATVSLRFAVNPGYQVRNCAVYSNISAFDPEDRVLVESTFADGVISFTMPAEPVDVEFAVSVNSYELTFVSESADALAQVSNVYNAENTVIRTVEGNTRFVPFGTRVKVTLNNNSSYYNKKVKATGLRIEGVDYLVEDGGSDVFFTMPYHAVEAEVLFEYNYRDIELINSDHITLHAYKLVEGEYVELSELKAVCDDVVYIKAVVAEDSGFAVNTLKAAYRHGTYSYDVNVTVNEPNADGYYSFTMPEASNPVKVTVTEINPTKYQGKEFVGSFIGFNLYGGKPYNGTSLSSNASITAGGVVSYRGSAYEIGELDETNKVISMADGEKLGYCGNFLFGCYNLTSTRPISNDNMIFFKLPEGESASDYKAYAVQTSTANRGNNIIQIYKNDEMVDSLFIHFLSDALTDYEAYTGVKFTFTSGSKVSEIGEVAFEVKTADGSYLCEFSGTNSSSSAALNYSVKDGLQGTYTNAEKGDLVLDGVGGATLNGETGFSYVAGENNTYIVSRETNTAKDVYVITLGEGTYTVDSESHEALVSSIFRGFTFTGTHLDSWGDSEAVKVVFDDKAGDITGTIVIGAYAHHDFGFTAVYDETEHVLTFTIVSELYSEGFVDQVITASVADGAITFTSSFTGSNAATYNILNSVCSNADFHL